MGTKKVFSTRVDDEKVKELKHLAVDLDKSLSDLVEEGIALVLAKYRKPDNFQPKKD